MTSKPSKKTTRKSASKPRIKKVAFVYRPRKPEALRLAKDLVEWLKNLNINSYTHPDQKAVPGSIKMTSKVLSQIDLVISLGGDGTYLKAVRLLEGKPIPVLGVNLGFLGFLTEIKSDEVYQCLEMAIDGSAEIKTRTMLQVNLLRKGQPKGSFLALNDVVVERGSNSRLIHMSVKTANSLISEVKADGLIVSTPTGSSAYNLAAGGPIIHPEVSCLVVTPICPHSLTDRPLTLSDDNVITLSLLQPKQAGVFMIDGQKIREIDEFDQIEIRRAEPVHYRMTMASKNYFDLLRSKLNFGRRD